MPCPDAGMPCPATGMPCPDTGMSCPSCYRDAGYRDVMHTRCHYMQL